MRTPRDFGANPPWLRQWYLKHTWCNTCNKADLGMIEPNEYEEDGRVYVEGDCEVCGERVFSEVVERETS